MKDKDLRYITPRLSTRVGHEGEIISYVVNFPYPKGGKYCKTFKVKDYKSKEACMRAAIKDRDRILVETEENPNVNGNNGTVEEVYSHLFEQFPLSKASEIKYDKAYRKYIKPYVGKKKIKDVTYSDVVGSLKECARYCCAKHVSHIKTVWNCIFKTARRMNIQVENFVNDIQDIPNQNVSKRKTEEMSITREEFQEFITFMSQYGNYSLSKKEKIYFRQCVVYMMELMFETGMRPQECKALVREDIQFTSESDGMEVAWIHIRHSVGSTLDEMLTIRKTKTPQSIRALPLEDEKCQLVKEILAWSEHEVIFADYDGNLIDATKLSDYIRRVRKAYNKKTGKNLDMFAVRMRKAKASELYRNGVSPVVIKNLLGHEKPDMSIQHYATSTVQERREALNNRNYIGKDSTNHSTNLRE